MIFNHHKVLAIVASSVLFFSATATNPSQTNDENVDTDKYQRVTDRKVWFVSPNGSAKNKGTHLSPWDIKTALNGGPNGEIQDGDKIRLLDGQYDEQAVSQLKSNHSHNATTLPLSIKYIVTKPHSGGKSASGATAAVFPDFGKVRRKEDDPNKDGDVTDENTDLGKDKDVTGGNPKSDKDKDDVIDGNPKSDKDIVNGRDWFASPNGSAKNKGTYDSPWDLQTALNGGPNGEVGIGNNIWLLSGRYRGRFVSLLKSSNSLKPIQVSSYRDNWAILNGNISNTTKKAVLTVKGGNVVFKNFEITHLGGFTRDMNNSHYKAGWGINHIDGEDCKFINLIIHDNPGAGIGSWKTTGGTEFYGNLVYNNGYLDFRSGQRLNHGPAFYVQNASNKIRLFENNVVFNNFTHGYEIWSADKRAGDNAVKEYVKNITLKGNSIFNNALDFRASTADVVISSLDSTGFNAPKNITIQDSEIYKNKYNPGSGYGSAIRLNEYSSNVSPLKNITIKNNLLVSRNQVVVIGKTESLTFRNNVLVTGFLSIKESTDKIKPYKNWNFGNNTYYTKAGNFLRINKKYSFDAWQKPPFNLDRKGSRSNQSSAFPAPQLSEQKRVRIIRNKYKPSRFKVSIYQGNRKISHQKVPVDFSKVKGIDGLANKRYKIIDVENYPRVMNTGRLRHDKTIYFNLGDTLFNYPKGSHLGSHKFSKTLKNYGVFWVEFAS